MKDRKKLLETKLELNDQQLENVGGAGWPRDPNQLYYCLCNECGWRFNKVPGMKHLNLKQSIDFSETRVVRQGDVPFVSLPLSLVAAKVASAASLFSPCLRLL